MNRIRVECSKCGRSARVLSDTTAKCHDLPMRVTSEAAPVFKVKGGDRKQRKGKAVGM